MGRARMTITLPGRAAEAEELWYDAARWPSWIDGFHHVVSLDDTWPHAGARRVWDSKPGGRGRVVERVVTYEPRVGQRRQVEDERLEGTEEVAFQPGEENVTVALSIEYRLKYANPLTPLVDVLYVRRQVGASLGRTLSRFAAERQGDLP
jgi:polyketide cyclase/dehydrase/lipid transport protein